MKVYRVTADKRSPLTAYAVVGFIAVIITIVSAICVFYMLQNEFEIWIGESIIIDSATISTVSLFSLCISLVVAVFAFEKNKLKHNERCLDVFIKDENNHLYYVTLNRGIFDLKLSPLMLISRGQVRYHSAMVSAWNRYCEDILCSDNIAGYLPSILQGKITLNDQPAVLAMRIREIEQIHEIKNGIRFVFGADGTCQRWTAGAYNYMNDYEELVELIKSKKA